MQKFGKKYIKQENKFQRIEDRNDEFLDDLIRRKIRNVGVDTNTYSLEDYSCDRQSFNALLHYSEMPYNFRKWYDKEILNHYNKGELFSLALRKLTYQTYDNNKKTTNTIIKSLKLTNFVEDILYNSKDKNFIVKTKNGKYNLSRTADTFEEAIDNIGNCHPLTEEFARNNKGIDVVCGYYEDSLYNNRYHSVAINNKTHEVIDIAHNMRTDIDLYLNELNYKIIVQEEAEDYFKNLTDLKAKNDLFKKSNLWNLLKYAINKQMKLEELNNTTKKKILK